MSILSDFVEQVTKSVVNETKKSLGVGTKRRRRRLSPSQKIAKEIEKMVKPAKKQTSRKRSSKARSKSTRRSY